MNILMIRPSGGYSGAEKYNISLAKSLHRYAPEIELIYLTNQQQFIEELEKEKILVYKIPLIIKEIGTKHDLFNACLKIPYYFLRFLIQINQIKNKKPFSIVCLQSMTEKIFLTSFLRLLGYKVLWLEHGPLFVTSRTAIIKKFYRMLSVFAKQIIVVSNNTKKDLIFGGVAEKRISIIPGGIDIKYFSPDKKKKNKKIIGFSGNINKEKGIWEFISIAKIIIKKEPKCSFLILGDGPDFKRAKEEVEKLHLEKHIQFTGFQHNVKSFLSNMDIFFFPTNHQEGISISLLEAASMELLILTHDIGGNNEIVIDGKTGFLYKQYNKEKLAEKLINLMNNYKYYEKIKENARIFVTNHYSTEKIAKEFSRFIQFL